MAILQEIYGDFMIRVSAEAEAKKYVSAGKKHCV
jgi:hypothetical protein